MGGISGYPACKLKQEKIQNFPNFTLDYCRAWAERHSREENPFFDPNWGAIDSNSVRMMGFECRKDVEALELAWQRQAGLCEIMYWLDHSSSDRTYRKPLQNISFDGSSFTNWVEFFIPLTIYSSFPFRFTLRHFLIDFIRVL